MHKTNSQPIARLLKVDQRLLNIDQRFLKVDQRFLKVDQRLLKMDQRLLKVDQRMHLQQWTSSVCLRLFARSPSCAVAMIPGCHLTD